MGDGAEGSGYIDYGKAITNEEMATGYRPNDKFYQDLKGKVNELYPVGDCYAPKRALDAIHS